MTQAPSLVTLSGSSKGFSETTDETIEAQSEAASRPKTRLTAVKLAILRTVLKHRLLTLDQIQRLCLPCGEGQSRKGRLEYTRHLLRVLYQHKYLVRRELIQSGLGRNRLVFASTWPGAQAVAEHADCAPQELGWDPHDKVITWTNENLQHLVMENEVNIIFTQACAGYEIRLQEWRSDRMLYQQHQGKKVLYPGPHGGTYEKVLIPDGLYIFARPIEIEGLRGTVLDRVLVEIDMGTQTLKQRQKTIKQPQRTWAHKVKAYLAYFQSGGLYEQMYGSQAGRVLIITTSAQRLVDMKGVTEEAGGNERFWFTTFEQLAAETALTEPIYCVATQGMNRYRLLNNAAVER